MVKLSSRHPADFPRAAFDLLSLNDLLRWRAFHQPDRLAYTFLVDGEAEEVSLTYGQLDLRARAISLWLRGAMRAGDRALLLYPPGLEYISAFFGCLYAGVVPVPVYPPRRNQNLLRLEAIVADAQAGVALTTSRIKARVEPLCVEAPCLKTLCWLATDEAADAPNEGCEVVAACGDDLAFFQYTSGSTGKPRGVMLSHRNLLSNAALVYQAMEHTEEDSYVSWLPTFHDMGFMAGTLQPLYAGIPAVLMSPSSFLQRPVRWLQAVSRYRATTSGAPNFAYDLCARKVTAEQRAGLDLSSWTGAFNGAEPIRAQTIEAFAEAFAPCGFRRESFYPCYGLAEATLIVTGGLKKSPPVVAAFQPDALENNLAREAGPEEEGARRLVGCGRALPGQQVVIVNPETLSPCAPQAVGEVWVAGPSVARGYWNRGEETERTFGARLGGSGEERFLRTGDLGFTRDGELFITGRLKDLIIIRGLNHYPQDIELTVERCHPALRPNACAAFSVEAGGEERLAVVAEAESRRQTPDEELFETIRQAVSTEHELELHACVLLRPGGLPKTSSGKIQRHECRRRLLSGELESVARWDARDVAGAPAQAAYAEGDGDEIERWLAGHLAARLGLDPGRIDAGQPLAYLGIDSLQAVELVHGIEAGLGVSLPMVSFLQDLTLAQLAAQARELKARPSEPAAQASAAHGGDGEGGRHPLSYGQRAMWFLHRLAPDSPAYNVAAPVRILAELDAAALQRAFQLLFDRHDSLRTTFTVVDGEPVQRVRPRLEPDFHVTDATAWEEATVNEALAGQTLQPFDLEAGPLLRIRLLKRSAREYILLLVAHHIIIDFWSLAVLLEELGAAYRVETEGGAAALPPAPRYADFARREFETIAGPRGEELRAFWVRELAGELPVLNLLGDRPRPAAQTFRGASHSISLGAELTQALGRLGRAHGATAYTTLLALFQVWLYRHTGQEEFIVGSPTSGRGRSEFARLVGYCVNPVALRADLAGDPSFDEFLGRVRRRVLSVFEHQEYPLALLVERMRMERDLSQAPLFQVMFVLQKANLPGEQGLASFAAGCAGARVRLGELLLESLPLEQQVVPFDLALTAAETEGGLALALQYNTDLFDATTAARMLERFRVLVAGVVADASRPISELEVLTEAERREVLTEWNETAAEYAEDLPVHHLFEAQAERTPHAAAVVAGAESCTYVELNRRANQLAHRLRALGVGAETKVGVYLERSVEMVVSYLAVLKAGGAYLPCDPSYPAHRISYMLEDAAAPVVLTSRKLSGTLPPLAARAVCVDDDWPSAGPEGEANPAPVTLARHLAYVIYTSGSTGRPKGVEVEHRGLVNLVTWHQRAYGVTAGDRATQLAAPAFDASVWELWPYLTAGASVYVVGEEVRASAPRLLAWLAEHSITICFLPTPLAEAVLNEPAPADLSLRILLTGGDRLHRGPAKAQGYSLVNHYGPTEYTVVATRAVVAPDAGDGKAPPIGRPIANTQAYVLDAALRPVPPGARGELCLGGAGLARGYLNRAGQTAERFVPHPYSGEPGARLYRTGDVVRQLAGGELEYAGRADTQVKVRGFRIELGEIEAVLAEQPGVGQSAVVVREAAGGDPRLLAYLVAEAGAESSSLVEELRAQARRRLPQYMVPSSFLFLDALPLTPNGKVDRRALAARAAVEPEAEDEPSASRDEVEELLRGIWSEVLGGVRVRPRDNFFDLGGHSLLATQMISRVRETFRVELQLRSLFETPTVAGLAAAIKEAVAAGQQERTPPVVPVLRDEVLPLSYAQQRLWFLDQLEPGNPFYNIAGALRLRGRLDAPALGRSVNEVVRRHEALRTTFREAGGEPVQVIAPSLPLELGAVELGGLPAAEREREVGRLAVEEARRPFDLSAGPLLRVRLLRLGDEEHVLLLTMHHIVSDGWSVRVLTREVAALYEAYSKGRPSPLAELTVQYADFAHWQRRLLESGTLRGEMDYWKQQLDGSPRLLELPTDHPRPAVQTHRGAAVALDLPPGLARALRALGRREGATLFMTLLAAFKALLYRYTRQTDLSVGTPVAGRGRVEIEDLIGFFANTLVLRSRPAGGLTFRDLLRQVREAVLSAHLHQDVPFERLVEELQPERELSHSPLFQVMFVLQDAADEALALPGLSASLLDVHNGTSKFDLLLSVVEGEGRFACTLEYGTDLFEAETARRLLGHFRTLLEAAAADPSATLDALPLLTPREERRLLSEWNEAETPYEAGSLIHEHFERQAARTPVRVALVCGAERLSYAQLDARANQLAHHLRKLGVGPDVLVGLSLERSPDMLVALLGVLKAGGAYLPLDPEYPAERLSFMLEDSGVHVLITQQRLLGRLPVREGVRVLALDADWPEQIARESAVRPPSSATSDHLAYTIYTSGSTGRPKGVQISHRALVNFILDMRRRFPLAEGEAWLSVTSLSFDIAALELYLPLVTGARVVLAPRDVVADAAALGAQLRECEAAVMQATPATWRMLVEAGWEGAAGLKALCGGEALAPELARELLTRVGELWNLYGPTETTIWSLLKRVEGGAERITIGRPIANTQVYVLDEQRRPVPPGVTGELYIGGEGLARGYLGRPALTAERFVPHPFAAVGGARLYRTGDLVRALPGGEIEFLGRNDQQVKVRGYRIEPGEIEAALRQHPSVLQAVVAARGGPSADVRLVAYVVVERAQWPGPSELRRFVHEKLPAYMMPALFVPLDALPLTPNGKVDRRALPDPEPHHAAGGETYAAPRTPAEEVLAGIWAEVLGLGRVGAEVNFFELGGHSLLATRAISRARAAFRMELPLRMMFEEPTVRGFAAALERMRGQGAQELREAPLVPAARGGELPLSFAQQRLWFLEQLEPDTAVYNLTAAVRLTGGRPDADALERSFNEIIRRHEVLRMTFSESGGTPVATVAAELRLPLRVLKLTGLPEPERAAAVQGLIREEARLPFDLARGPLVRSTLLELAEEESVLLVTMHHIVSDGWSLNVFVKEVAELYAAFSRGLPSPLPAPPAVQYADFACWQRQRMRGEVLQAQLDYWKRHLAGAPTVLELPADHPRPPVKSYRGAVASLALPAELGAALGALGLRQGATVFMVLLAAFEALLYRYTSQEEIVVGTPIAGRNRVELEPLIGLFANTLALRTDLSGDPPFAELLGRVRETVLDAHAHQDLPLERLIEELHPERDLSRTPLFQVMFAFQNAPLAVGALAGLKAEVLEVDGGVSKFDLLLSVSEHEGVLRVSAEYSTDLFEEWSVRRLLGHYAALLRAAAADPGARLSELELLGEGERRRLLVEWNETGAEYPRGECLHELFEAQAARTPDATALVTRGGRLSYAELNRRANRLAHHLRQLSAGPETPVMICLSRSAELVVALLAVLKAGAAYVPLDPAYPRQRLAFMIEDSDSPVLVTERALLHTLPPHGAAVVCVDDDAGVISSRSAENPPRRADASNLAYIIYTSGSTGRPKGVAIEHRSAVALAYWAAEVFDAEELGGVLASTSVCFDLSVYELFVPLSWGGTVVLAENALELPALRGSAEVRLLNTVPSVATELLRLDLLPESVRTVNLAGEALSNKLVQQLYERGTVGRVFNLYGPSEDTTYSTYALTRKGAQRTPPIGRPIANTQVYLLDRHLRPVPTGVAGELYLGGQGLARAYFNRPALTAERFVPHPFSAEPGARLYRTGDLARYLPDGELEYLGRSDQQVKLRGFRIELGEIEAALGQHEAVRESAVVVAAAAEGRQRLVACVCPANGAVSPGELRQYLKQRLPEYMIPGSYVAVEELPLTANGKVDRRALRGLAERAEASAGAGEYVGAVSPTEEVLAGIWEQVLGVERVGVHDDFFELGGHSLLATQVAAKVREAFRLEPPLRAFFEAPTVRTLAGLLDRMRGDETARGPARPALAPVARERFRGRLPAGQLLETSRETSRRPEDD